MRRTQYDRLSEQQLGFLLYIIGKRLRFRYSFVVFTARQFLS